MTATASSPKNWTQSRRYLILRENLTDYLFLAPAASVIFLFGLVPVLFAFFVSLYRWRRFPDEFRGLDNYVNAIGNFAYVLFLWMSVAAIAYGVFRLWRYWLDSAGERHGLLLIVPGAVIVSAIVAFNGWFFTLLPVVCLGNCDHAPTLMVNDELHDRVTPESADDLLATVRRARHGDDGPAHGGKGGDTADGGSRG